MGKTTHCRMCGTVMKPGTVSRCEASFGSCTIELHDFPILVCSVDESHPRSHVGPDFGSDLIGVLYFGNAPISRPKIWQGPECVRCGSALPETAIRSDTEVSFAVRVKEHPSFRITLRSRGATCARCGFVQAVVDRELDESLPEAMLQAFASMHVEP